MTKLEKMVTEAVQALDLHDPLVVEDIGRPIVVVSYGHGDDSRTSVEVSPQDLRERYGEMSVESFRKEIDRKIQAGEVSQVRPE